MLRRIPSYYNKVDDKTKTMLFFFEGTGRFTGASSTNYYNKNSSSLNALVAVVKKGKLQATFKGSTMPDNPWGNNATIASGIYSFVLWIHGRNSSNPHPALQVRTYKTQGGNLPATYGRSQNLVYGNNQQTYANGINVHTNYNSSGAYNSEGCLVIDKESYVEFAHTVGMMKSDYYKGETNIWGHDLSYAQNALVEKMTGYVIVDRVNSPWTGIVSTCALSNSSNWDRDFYKKLSTYNYQWQ